MTSSTGFFVVHDTLLQRIAQAEAQLDQRIAAAQLERRAPEATQSMPALTEAPAPAPAAEPAPAPATDAPDYDPDVAPIFSEEATELLEAAQSASRASDSVSRGRRNLQR